MSLSKSATPSPVVESIYQNYISVCGICLSAYEVPKALPCLHSFCLQCLREWAAHNKKENTSGNHKITCPNCRKEYVFPVTGVDGLPTNFFITERCQVEKPPDCNSCRKADREIVARCHECGFICKDCLLAHRSLRALEDHAIIELEKLRMGKTVKQVGNLQIGDTKGYRMPGNGIFRLKKTVDLESINAWCCAISNDIKYEIVVPTFGSSTLYIFESNGKQKLKIDTKEGLEPGCYSSPWAVAFNTDGYFYITDCNPWIKVHDADGRFMHLFQIFNTSGARCTEGTARGIAIDSKHQIIVGDGESKTISIFKPDESYINSFKLDIKPYFIGSTPRNTLLVSDVNCGKIIEVDYSGKVLNTITSPIKGMDWEPRGACCSKDGEIFVVNAAKDKCCVCRFTSSWQYTGCVISDLEEPRGIAISQDGEVLVVINTGSKMQIFSRS